MRAIVDASVKDGTSRHSYILKSWKGQVISEKKFNGFADKSTEAEMNTIECLLKYCLEKKFNKIYIYTDCLPIVEAVNQGKNKNIDVSYLVHLLKVTKSKLKWVKRSKVSQCDYNCKHVHKRKIKSGLLIK